MTSYQSNPTNNFCIKVTNLSVKIQDNLILDNVTFTVNKGMVFTIIGPNGAGKSTLVKTILGLVKPISGSVEFANEIKIGFVPQKFRVNNFLPITVKEFLKISQEINHNEGDLQAIIAQFNLNYLTNYPLQKISGGEMQRVLLARALIKKPNLLILDEPTQGLDINGQNEFYQLLGDIEEKSNLTIILVSHDLNFVMRQTSQVICLNKHICCQGSPENINNDAEFIKIFGKNYQLNFTSYKHSHNHIH